MSVAGNELFELSRGVLDVASRKVSLIEDITRRTKMLAMNALIEASRAGDAGRGFAVVANEVSEISKQVNTITKELRSEIVSRVDHLTTTGSAMVQEMHGRRLADLSLNMIEIIDRNLYERSCDVRWWATDSAVVDCAADPTEVNRQHASHRLSVILESYTVYLDLWIADLKGEVIATGRPGRYPGAQGARVGDEGWFRQALATRNGGEFTVGDVSRNGRLEDRVVATYATAIRRGGEADGDPIGVLGIFFDWEPQAAAVVQGVRLEDEERSRSRCLLLDARHRVIASSDGRGILSETVQLRRSGESMGHYSDAAGRTYGYALTPGYETYKGLGWYGVIVQDPDPRQQQTPGPATAGMNGRVGMNGAGLHG
ncbi:methyl-accepting chemotaxis protein (MCP) signaling protein [Azospirillum brasilense]|uniref:Methyl-accepting chemotaxis protein (MCP) signaling protein n=1 Tax=Azospirillum brasilense TaxID=192 RepID=A0A560AJ38_AZOBR|nr:methyl-accepting chemotaxis protein [Azospirillum brasilense]TWA60349.1 methyl-accepting chemotaxis protein (MCP) signaling protein [Azospirillum brasilense]